MVIFHMWIGKNFVSIAPASTMPLSRSPLSTHPIRIVSQPVDESASLLATCDGTNRSTASTGGYEDADHGWILKLKLFTKRELRQLGAKAGGRGAKSGGESEKKMSQNNKQQKTTGPEMTKAIKNRISKIMWGVEHWTSKYRRSLHNDWIMTEYRRLPTFNRQ